MSTPRPSTPPRTTDGRAKSKDPVTGRPAGAGSAARKPARWPWALLVVALVVAVIAVAAKTFADRHTYTVTVTPGASALVVVEIPTTGGAVTGVSRGSEVTCRVGAGEGGGQVGVAVIETGQRTDALWARLRITAEPGAATGRREHQVAFDVDGASFGADVLLVVQVRP